MYIVSIVLAILSIVYRTTDYLIAAGLFTIAGIIHDLIKLLQNYLSIIIGLNYVTSDYAQKPIDDQLKDVEEISKVFSKFKKK